MTNPERCPHCDAPGAVSEEGARHCENCGNPFDSEEMENEVAYHAALDREAMKAYDAASDEEFDVMAVRWEDLDHSHDDEPVERK